MYDDYNMCVIPPATALEVSLAADKAKKAPKRRRGLEDSGETAKRRSARVRNTKCKKEEKIDFQELLYKYLPSRYGGRCRDESCRDSQGSHSHRKPGEVILIEGLEQLQMDGRFW